jgi:hypothetical protein
MFHGLDNQFLYAAYKITSVFGDGIGAEASATGTGFFLKNETGQTCLVTNRHMVDLHYPKIDATRPGYKLQRILIRGRHSGGMLGLPNQFTEFAIAPTANFLFSSVVENDVTCLVNPPILAIDKSASVVDFFIPHELVATKQDFENKLSVCDFVAFPGYPPWHDRLNERPILRTGAIASDPRSDYSFSGNYDGECVAYEAFSFGGSSGSPVFAVQKGPRPGAGITFPGFRELLFIGINAGHLITDTQHHSGISYLYKSSAILDIIDG